MELSLMEKQIIEEKVSTLLTQYGYSFEHDTDVDIIDFAHRLNFVVGNADLPDNEDGFLAIQPRNSEEGADAAKIIGVNAKRPLDLKRFIIAHEFAHSELHYRKGKAFLHRENVKGKNDEENDADYFAAALLMPQVSFKRVYSELDSQGLSRSAICSQLASIFKVPLESVLRRIDEVVINE